MTERKRSRNEASTHRLSVFIAMLAHELRNHLAPLRTVGVLQSLPAAAARARAMPSPSGQVGQLTRLVDDLLDVGRITAGKARSRHAPVTSATSCIAAWRASSRNWRRASSTSRRLPPRRSSCAATTRLVQVLHNLLDNASKYSPNGSQIEVHVRTEASVVAIDVVDRGIGIVPGAQESIFDLFDRTTRGPPCGRRARSRPRDLPQIRRPARRQHHRRQRRHRQGFVVYRAAAARAAGRTRRAGARRTGTAHDAPAAHPGRRRQSRSGRHPRRPARIKGHTARVAYHARDAVPLARDFAPQLMLIDLSMPDVNGFELLRELNATRIAPDAFRVALSGHAFVRSQGNRRRRLRRPFREADSDRGARCVARARRRRCAAPRPRLSTLLGAARATRGPPAPPDA
jgi:CheY-like chemotaxis protein